MSAMDLHCDDLHRTDRQSGSQGAVRDSSIVHRCLILWQNTPHPPPRPGPAAEAPRAEIEAARRCLKDAPGPPSPAPFPLLTDSLDERDDVQATNQTTPAETNAIATVPWGGPTPKCP
jgi:hypothetical protein